MKAGYFSNLCMIKLEIKVRPKKPKYIEFSQSLNSMTDELLQLCPGLLITEKNKTFILIADLNSSEHLTRVLNSKHFSILSGAIKMIGGK